VLIPPPVDDTTRRSTSAEKVPLILSGAQASRRRNLHKSQREWRTDIGKTAHVGGVSVRFARRR
jgi:hypothetical protein